MVLRAIMRRIGARSRVVLVSDALVALVAGVGEAAGVVVLSGTGSIAYGRNARHRPPAPGGWGYVLGDEGSGYWISRQALRAVVRAADGRGPVDRAHRAGPVHFGIGVALRPHRRDLRAPGASSCARPGRAARAAGPRRGRRGGDADPGAGRARAGPRCALGGRAAADGRDEPVHFVLAGGVFTGVPWLSEELQRRLPGSPAAARVDRLEVRAGRGRRAARARRGPRRGAHPEPTRMREAVVRAGRPRLEDGWDDPAWADAEALDIAFRPEGSDHRPRTRARLVRRRGPRRPLPRRGSLRALGPPRFGDPVYTDSCVEVFLQPKPDRGYLNFEMKLAARCSRATSRRRRTPGGFAAFTRHRARKAGRSAIALLAAAGASSPRSTRPSTGRWRSSCRPGYSRATWADRLARRQEWRANLYKCGDETSHPHWAAWSPVDALNFHLPRCFGTLRFEAPPA